MCPTFKVNVRKLTPGHTPLTQSQHTTQVAITASRPPASPTQSHPPAARPYLEETHRIPKLLQNSYCRRYECVNLTLHDAMLKADTTPCCCPTREGNWVCLTEGTTQDECVREQGTETSVWATGDNYIMRSFTICTPHQN